MPRNATKTEVKKTQGRGRPRKAIVQKTTVKRSWFRWGESYTNVLFGIIVVIIGTLFIASLAKTRHTQTTSSTSTYNIPTEEQQTTPNPQKNTANMYVVKEGDDLWSIAEKTYKSGYNWVDIARANNIENPDQLDAGQKLVLPTVTPMPTTIAASPSQQVAEQQRANNEQAIKTNTYVIQPGDTLWDIATRAYADGYKWTDIAKANNLENPDLIFSGNTLQIPR